MFHHSESSSKIALSFWFSGVTCPIVIVSPMKYGSRDTLLPALFSPWLPALGGRGSFIALISLLLSSPSPHGIRLQTNMGWTPGLSSLPAFGNFSLLQRRKMVPEVYWALHPCLQPSLGSSPSHPATVLPDPGLEGHSHLAMAVKDCP